MAGPHQACYDAHESFAVPPVTYRASSRRPLDVEADLCRLWRDNLGLATSAEDKFHWLYRDAPDAADTVFVLEAVENDQARVVGANGMVRRRFWVAGRELRAVVSCDFAVDRAHRSLFPALSLLRMFREDVAARFDLAYGFPNEKAEGVLKRAGFKELGRTRRWAKVLRHAGYATRLSSRQDVLAVVRLAASRPWVARAVAAIVDVTRAAAGSLTMARGAVKYQVRSHDAPDERWDALWHAARDEYDVAGARTSAFLRWRFAQVPDIRFVTIQRRGDQRLRAYAVLQFDHVTGAAHVRDLFGHHEDLGGLIDALAPLAYRAGASSLSVRYLGAPAVERLFAGRGFTLREGSRCVVLDTGPAADGAIVADANRWHLLDVDEDA